MPNDIQSRIVKLIESLYIPEQAKKELLDKVASFGVSEELIARIKQNIDQSIEEYEKQTQTEVNVLQDKLKNAVNSFNQEFKEIEQETKAKAKQAVKEKDAKELENLRSKLAA